MMTKLLTVLVLLTVAPAVEAQQSDYTIGPQDVITVTVWDQPDVSGKFTVDADGTLNFPLLGRLRAAGLTLRDLEAEIQRQLADGYLKNPQVTAAVELYRSQRVFIIGEVRSPGTYQLTGDMTLIEALARAGSTTATAGDEALIVRPPSGSSGPVLPDQQPNAEVLRANLRELQTGVLAQNVALRDGDTIFVPRAQAVYVVGQVKTPGAYAIEKGTTVLQAISLAGGLTDRGSDSRIKIIRLVDGRKKELKVKLIDTVEPGDTIVIPERFF